MPTLATVLLVTALAPWGATPETPAPAPASPTPDAATHAAHEHAHAHSHGDASDAATVRHSFDDVERWSKVFDDPERDAWQKPALLVQALGIAAGDRVADIGAGTGYFEAYLARAVGAAGSVLAVEVEPNLVAHLRDRAETAGTANVTPVLASLDNPRLPPASTDLVLVVDTYHHIDQRKAYFRGLAGALTARGRVVIVDFEKRALPVGPPVEHKLAKEAVVAEMRQAGYGLDRDLEILPHQYVLVFRPVTPDIPDIPDILENGSKR